MATAKTAYALPRGVSIRTLKTVDLLQIAFTYKGRQCRELLPEKKITKAYIDYAAGLRHEILRKIADDVFNYTTYFPNSPTAAVFVPERKWVLMGDLLRKQLAYYQQQVVNGTLSSSTLLGYTKIINGTLIPKWGDTAIKDLAPSMLREWIGQMGATAKTVRNVLSPLRSVLDDAVNDELLEFNPLDRVALSKIIRQTAKKSEYDVDPFDSDETEALLKHARLDERNFIQFWFNTGLRPGEIIAFPWPNVDWVHGSIRIDTNIVTGIVDGKQTQVEKPPKTAAGIRDIELSAAALNALTAQKAASFLAGGRVWLNPRTNEPWTIDSQIRKTLWEPLCKRAGVRYRNPYQIRHTYASTLLTAGRNPFWLAGQMGHEDVEMIFKVYGKWIDANYQKTRSQPDRCESRVNSV